MSLQKEDIEKLADLARINLSSEEQEEVLQDLSSVIGYVSEINTITDEDINVEATHNNIVREDDITNPKGAYTDQIINNAPASHNGYIQVDQVL